VSRRLPEAPLLLREPARRVLTLAGPNGTTTITVPPGTDTEVQIP
jgi:hypothetical protein